MYLRLEGSTSLPFIEGKDELVDGSGIQGIGENTVDGWRKTDIRMKTYLFHIPSGLLWQ